MPVDISFVTNGMPSFVINYMPTFYTLVVSGVYIVFSVGLSVTTFYEYFGNEPFEKYSSKSGWTD